MDQWSSPGRTATDIVSVVLGSRRFVGVVVGTGGAAVPIGTFKERKQKEGNPWQSNKS
jgi:hypothetical protein